MRVIAGEAGGRKLKSGQGTKARPTTDMVKEALFNTLGNRVIDATCLDLFAGFGGVGIEALSRGATKVVFVEQDPKHVAMIKENLVLTKLNERAQVVRGDVIKVLATLHGSFDVIYIDPPYESGLYESTMELVLGKSLLHSNGVLILEHNKALIPQIPEAFEILRSKTYGETGLTILGLKG